MPNVTKLPVYISIIVYTLENEPINTTEIFLNDFIIKESYKREIVDKILHL